MTKKVKWGVTGVIGLMVAGMFFYPQLKSMWTTSETDIAAPAPGTSLKRQVLNINAEVVTPRSLTDKILSTGSTMPDEEVDLAFESSGKVVAIYFTEGTHVKAGDLLAKINDKPLQAQLKKLEAQVPLANDRVYRQRTLLAKDAVSQEAFELVATEQEKLMADIELIKANIAQTELRAPFEGIIGLRSVSEGAYVTSSSSVIAKLTKISPLKIEFNVSENYASEVKDGTPITFRLERGGLMQSYHATVYAVESRVDTDTRTLRVRAKYPNVGEAIMPGRYTSVEVTRREIKDALAIPSEALIPEMGKDIVYLYRGGTAEPVEVKIGLRTEERVQILSGLTPGDTLITSGVMQLRSGTKVTIDHIR